MPRNRRSASESARPPCNAALAFDAFKIPDQQRTKVNAGKKRWAAKLWRIELGTQPFDEAVKVLRVL